MSEPMDPTCFDDGPTEYSWGAGIFPPGIADNEGQRNPQDDFGENQIPRTNPIGDVDDTWAKAVADRRTDSTDPESGRDFETYGNPDRYGAQPPLVRARPQPNISQNNDQLVREPLQRKP